MITMNHSTIFLQLFYALVLFSVYRRPACGEADHVKCMENERQALLIFKQSLVDNLGYVSSWGSEDCCKWSGVRCSNRTGHVVMLDLNSYLLGGNISSSLLVLQHLNYLDLSVNDFAGNQIPEFIGSLTKLRFLDLSSANFGGRVPYQLGNLTNLQSLKFGFDDIHVSKFEWLSHLYKLTSLSLVDLDLEEATDWLQVITGLPSLTELDLSSSIFPSINYKSHSLVNSSTSLAHLHLSSCRFSEYHLLSNISKSLVELDVSDNYLQGSIPDYAFHNMTSLVHLDLSSNQIRGISKSLGDMCSLKTLRMYDNNLTGPLHDLFFNLSGCARKSLEILMLGRNKLSGSFPDITQFSSLRELDISINRLDGSLSERFRQPSPLVVLDLGFNQLWGSLPNLSAFPLLKSLAISYNRLNGTVNQSLGQLSRLEELKLNSNSLQGLITEAHLSHLSKLKTLDFSYNSLALNFNPDWIPPFQLGEISLRSCTLGPYFPKWLRSQKNYSLLDISNAGISDTVPDWFWDDLSHNFQYLNLSYNQMKGKVPDLSSKFSIFSGIDLSSNCFEGSIPSIPSTATLFFLSKNMFSGSISLLCNFTGDSLWYLDLSNNQLSGGIPDCSGYWKNLIFLNLANNNFSGKIPNSMDSDCSLRSLHLRNNSLTGELPSSLKNCRLLMVIDLGNNNIFGSIPLWIDETLSNLAILSLRSNYINGNLPQQICNLAQVQVLDVADNNISGSIPKCLNSLTTMVETESPNAIINYVYARNGDMVAGDGWNSPDEAWLVWKGVWSEYKTILRLVKSIDLSSNKLSGEIPEEVTSLVGLLSLNLSRNSLTGPIPPNIGRLTMLNSLDLSQNQLNGKIPESSSQLSHLGVLNLSNNNLSGKIPSGTQLQTFDTSSFMGNPNLCDFPFPIKCPGEESAAPLDPPIVVDDSQDDRFITLGFYITAVLGFIVGFWGFCGALLLNKKWRYAYFQLFDHVKDKLYVFMGWTI